MLPAVYRLWARLRLAESAPWVAGWDLEELYGGVPGRGADKAWYKVAAELEADTSCGGRGWHGGL